MKKESKSNLLRNVPRLLHVGVVAVLVIVAVVSTSLYFTERGNSLGAQKQAYPFIDPSRHLIAQEHYLSTIHPLRQKIRDMVTSYERGKVSIYIEYLNTGANISINPDVYIWPASLTKVPLALAVAKKIEKEEWEYHNELVLMRGDANQYSGDSENPLSEYPIGTRFTIETLLKELLVNSDNTAYYILLRNLHEDDLKEVVDSLGMDQLFAPDGRISTKEYTRILRALYTASFLNRENSQKVLTWLTEAQFHSFLSAGLPEDVLFAHKYGEDDKLRAYSDSGIVYLENRPYIIAVMMQSDGSEPYEEAQEHAAVFMKTVSAEVFQFFSSAKKGQ